MAKMVFNIKLSQCEALLLFTISLIAWVKIFDINAFKKSYYVLIPLISIEPNKQKLNLYRKRLAELNCTGCINGKSHREQ